MKTKQKLIFKKNEIWKIKQNFTTIIIFIIQFHIIYKTFKKLYF